MTFYCVLSTVSSPGKVKCQHSKKAVNINILRKVLKQTDFCVACTVSTEQGYGQFITINAMWMVLLDFFGILRVQFQFSLFPAHINISYNNNNVYILCRKRGGQKTMLMDVRPLTITMIRSSLVYRINDTIRYVS